MKMAADAELVSRYNLT